MTDLIKTLNELRIASGLEPLQESTAKKMGRAKLEAAIEKLSSTEPKTVETPAEPKADDVPETLEARLAAGYSPWGGDPSNQTAAGADGTFLGDSCNLCHETGRAYNRFTGEEVDLPSSKTGKKRRVLNPQSKIDAKVEALTDVGIKVSYDRPARLWRFAVGKKTTQLTSREFSEYTPDELAAHIAGILKPGK